MPDESDDLAQALRRHEDLTGEYVQVEQGIHDGLSSPRKWRKARWSPLLAVLLLTLTIPLAVYAGGARFMPTPTGAPWPDASNTGVPTGTTLTTYTGSCTITTPNTVIDSKELTCPDGLDIKASGVQVRKSLLHGFVWLDGDLGGFEYSSLLLMDSEVDAGLVQLAAVSSGHITAIRANIHGGATSMQCEAPSGGVRQTTCIVRDSYLHGQERPDDGEWHLGGFLSEGGLISIELTHNYIVCDAIQSSTGNGCSGALNLLPWFGPAQNITITNNKLNAPYGSYCTYGGASATPYQAGVNNVRYRNNVFERGLTGDCAVFGPVTDFNASAPGNVWTNNRYDTGELVSP